MDIRESEGESSQSVVEPGELGLKEAITYPDPPDDLARFSWRTALKYFGPGAIIAGITIGSGETVFAARGGAVFGYAIMWTFVLGTLFKAAMQYSVNRYMVVAGEHPLQRWVTLFPGPRGWFTIFLAVISIGSFPLWAGGLSVGLGDFAASLWGGEGQIWATVFLVGLGALAWIGGYTWMERSFQFLIAFMLIALVIGVFVASPDWLDALLGLIPSVPSYESWIRTDFPEIASRPVWVEIVTYVGAIGGGTYDYIGYTGMLREKKWGLLGRKDLIELEHRFAEVDRGAQLPISDNPDELRKARSWARAPFGDVTLANIVVVLFAFAFIIQGANLLHEAQLAPSEDEVLTHQVRFLTVISPLLKYLWYAAAFVALGDTLYGLWEVYSYTTYESLGALSAKVRAAGVRAVRPYVYLYVGISGLIMVWTGADLVTIVTWAAILGGTLTMGAMALAMPWTERQMLPPGLRMKPAGAALVLVSGAVLLVLGVIAGLQGLGIIPSVE
jgi:Mn2+/Fe2+ NRAMP family transporter